MPTTSYTFRRIGTFRPPAYHVHAGSEYIGDVDAVYPGRPGQSRSTNRYRAHPRRAGRRYALELTLLRTPDGYFLSKRGTIFDSRREAADAILEYLRSK